MLTFRKAILHSTAAKTSSVRDVSVAPVGAGGGGNVYSPSTWAKQRRSEFKAGQLSHQQSMSVSNMANTVDMDDNERKIVTEFCHYLEKSKQLFNGLRLVKINRSAVKRVGILWQKLGVTLVVEPLDNQYTKY